MTIITEQSEGKVKEGSWSSNVECNKDRKTDNGSAVDEERERERESKSTGNIPTRSIGNMSADTGSFVTPRVESRGYTRYHQRQIQFSSVSRYHLNIEGNVQSDCIMCVCLYVSEGLAPFFAHRSAFLWCTKQTQDCSIEVFIHPLVRRFTHRPTDLPVLN